MIEVVFVGGPHCGERQRQETLPAVIERVHVGGGCVITARYVRQGGDLPERTPLPRRYRYVPLAC